MSQDIIRCYFKQEKKKELAWNKNMFTHIEQIGLRKKVDIRTMNPDWNLLRCRTQQQAIQIALKAV